MCTYNSRNWTGKNQPLLRKRLPSCHPYAAEPLFIAKDAWRITSDTSATETEVVDIVGNLCTASDILAENVRLPHPAIGVRITFTHAGRYACTTSPQLFGSQKNRKKYCSHRSPPPLRLLGQPAHKYRNMQGKAISGDPDHCIHNIPTEE